MKNKDKKNKKDRKDKKKQEAGKETTAVPAKEVKPAQEQPKVGDKRKGADAPPKVVLPQPQTPKHEQHQKLMAENKHKKEEKAQLAKTE